MSSGRRGQHADWAGLAVQYADLTDAELKDLRAEADLLGRARRIAGDGTAFGENIALFCGVLELQRTKRQCVA